MEDKSSYFRSDSFSVPVGIRDLLTIVDTLRARNLQKSSIVAISRSDEISPASPDLTVLTFGPLGTSESTEATLATSVYDDLLRVGWRNEQIVPNYQSDLKSRSLADFALFDDGKLSCLIEIKQRTSTRDNLILSNSLEGAASAPWLCNTDGSTFVLFNTQSRVSRESARTPTPNDLGIASRSSPHLQSNTNSLNYTSLDGSIRHRDTSSIHVILDSGLPVGYELRGSGLGDSIIADLRATSHVPANAKLDLHTGLLAWGALCAPSVSSFSAIVPNSILFAEHNRWVRELLNSRFGLSAVIGFRSKRHSRRLPVSLILLGFETEQVLFDDVDLDRHEDVPDGLLANLNRWLTNNTYSSGFTSSHQSGDSWSMGKHDPSVSAAATRLSTLGEVVPLGTLGEFFSGINLRKRPAASGGIPLIVGSAITDLGIDESVCETISLGIDERACIVNVGDILISTVSGVTKVRVAINHLGGAVISGSVIGFRLREFNTYANRQFLAQYLKSTVASLFLTSTASIFSGTQRLAISDLRQLPVPFGLSTFSSILADAIEMEFELRRKADELSVMRNGFFDATTIQDCETRSIEIQRTASIYSRSLEASSSRRFQVANFYPFPIAYGYRQLESTVGYIELYREQLRVAENLLAFLASTALSLVEPADRGELAAHLKKAWTGGISPGTWRDLLHVCAKLFSKKNYSHRLCRAFVELDVGSEKRGVGLNLLTLIRAKNDFKHDRGPVDEVDVANGSQSLRALLDDCISRFSFLMDFPLRRVIDFELRRGKPIAQVKCSELTGDHPALPQQIIELPSQIVMSTSLQKGGLYLDIGGNRWIDQYPFIQQLTCPRCKSRETYFIDKVTWVNGEGIFKSFERGHTETIADLGPNLETWLGGSFPQE